MTMYAYAKDGIPFGSPPTEAEEAWMAAHHSPDWEARLLRVQQGW